MNITIETTVAASIEDVLQARTTPDDIKQWNVASEDWHCPDATIDLNPGGQFSYRMAAKDGGIGFDFVGNVHEGGPKRSRRIFEGPRRSIAVEFIARGGARGERAAPTSAVPCSPG